MVCAVGKRRCWWQCPWGWRFPQRCGKQEWHHVQEDDWGNKVASHLKR